jgi:hypothetical protein
MGGVSRDLDGHPTAPLIRKEVMHVDEFPLVPLCYHTRSNDPEPRALVSLESSSVAMRGAPD